MNCRHWKMNEWKNQLGGTPQCAFDNKGKFLNTNWNCKLVVDLLEKYMSETFHCYVNNDDNFLRYAKLVLRYWEHEINMNIEGVVDEIEDVLMTKIRC